MGKQGEARENIENHRKSGKNIEKHGETLENEENQEKT